MTFNPELLPPVSQWKWVASIGHGTEKPIRNLPYQRWLTGEKSLHAPAHREAMLVLSGETLFSLNGKPFQKRPGTLFLFDSHESRDFKRSPYTGSNSCLWLHFVSRNFFSYNTTRFEEHRAAGPRSNRDLPTGCIKSGEAAGTIMDLWSHCRSHPEDILSWEHLKSHLAATCLDILGTSIPGRPSHHHHQQIITAIQHHIEGHLSQDLSLDHLADLAGYSPFFFHRLFVKYSGKTPKAYIDEVRLAKIRTLLKQNQTVETIAEAVGLASPSHLGVFFKRHMALTPMQWRKHGD